MILKYLYIYYIHIYIILLYLSTNFLPFLFKLQVDLEQNKVHEELVDYTEEHAGNKDGYTQLSAFPSSA